jgi:vacuolar-type H+-ATPase subunit E/Vma4
VGKEGGRLTIEDKIAHIQSVVMEEARGQGNAIIGQQKEALEEIFETHKEEALRQSKIQIKAETTAGKRKLTVAASKRQITIRREQTKVLHSLKEQLFDEVRELLIEYKKTEDYNKYLTDKIQKAVHFADGQTIILYIDPSDVDKKEFLEEYTGMTISISKEDFLGGIRAVLPEKNILMDYSFSSAMEKEYDEFTFKGGAGIG